MKRREFLKGLSVAASVATVPALAESNPLVKKWETVGDSSVRAHGQISSSYDIGLTCDKHIHTGQGGYTIDKETHDNIVKAMAERSPLRRVIKVIK